MRDRREDERVDDLLELVRAWVRREAVENPGCQEPGQARLLSRWYPDLRGGKFVVVVVLSESEPYVRHWVITAYIARRLAGGKTEWQRS